MPDVNTYWAVFARQLVTWSAHGLGAAGTVGYLSAATPGAITATAPSPPDITQPVCLVYDANTVLWTPGQGF